MILLILWAHYYSEYLGHSMLAAGPSGSSIIYSLFGVHYVAYSLLNPLMDGDSVLSALVS